MTARRLCQHCLLRFASILLALPFVLLSAVAPGYMPVQAADGTITMVICSDGATVEVQLDAASGETVAPHKAPSDGRCDWAQAAMAVAVLDAPALPVPMQLVSRFHPVPANDLWRPAHDPRGLWARGPPATV